MAVNRFAEATVAGRCHADAPDCGCDWPTMEATLWMAYAQRNPMGMAIWMNKAAVFLRGTAATGTYMIITPGDVGEMIREGRMERWLRMVDEAITPSN